MSQRKSNASYLIQGSILAIASIISRIIGLVYRIPLTAIIGDHGNDYYSTAFEIYSLLLMISSYSLPMAVSKMVSTRLAKKEAYNADRVFKGALIFALVSGTVCTLIIYFFAGPLCGIFKTPMAIYALRVLAPTLLIVAFLGVIRGFFQGLGTMIPSAISQVVEQIINAVVSVGAAYVLFHYGLRAVAAGADAEIPSAYGAAGGTLGTCIGALFGLLFVLFVYVTFRPSFARRVRKDRDSAKRSDENYSGIMKALLLTIIPILLSTTVYNLVNIVDQGLFKNIANLQNYSAYDISTWWGVYAGKYRVLVNVPISIASALAVSAVPALSGAFAKRQYKEVRHKIGMSLRFGMVVAFPCTAGLMVLASPIQQLLFNDATPLAANLMIYGSICVIFYSISTFSNAVLQSIDKMIIPVRNAVIALVIQAAALYVAMYLFKTNIYSVILANLVFSVVMCILNGVSVQVYSGFRVNAMKTFIKPAAASVIMGVCVYLSYLLIRHLADGIHNTVIAAHSSDIATVAAIVIGIIVYVVAFLAIRGITEQELLSFPKGTAIIRVGKKLHLLPK